MLPETFRTTRLLLRPVVVGDADAIFYTYAQDEEFRRTTSDTRSPAA
jgi:hypothetical protein